MADEKSHTTAGQIERATRLRKVIEGLKEEDVDDESTSKDKSLKEQIDDRALQQMDKASRNSKSE